MASITHRRRPLKTGRPLGMIDVLSKIVETAFDRIAARSATRQTEPVRDAAAVRRLAADHQHRAPGVAADLLAAADRHELGGSWH